MTRRVVNFTVPGVRSDLKPGERDNGKTFVITEMSTDLGERWCSQLTELIYAAARNPVPPDLDGSSGLASTLGVVERLHILRALQDPSLDALWDCVKYVHAPGHPPQDIASGANCQIEEIRTRTLLRLEVAKLHTDFFTEENHSTSARAAASKT
jgi:hypothetical protein